jgi:Xaa-Pro aminopeptidase
MNTLPPALDPKSCHSRQEAVRGLLKEQQLDAALFLNRNYVHALTAYWHEQSLTPVALIVPLNGKTILVAPGENLDVPAADEHLSYHPQELCTLVENIPARLSAAISQTLAPFKRIGTTGGVPTALVELHEWIDIATEYQNLRRCKYPDEVEVLRYAIQATEVAYAEARNILTPGLSELSLYASMQSAAINAVGEPLSAWGNDFRSGEPGGFPRQSPAAAGEIAVLDIGVGVRGYRSDLCRSFAVDRNPTDVQLKAHARVLEALDHSEKNIKPGTRCKRLFEDIHTQLDGWNGYSFYHHLGHAIGLDAHETPRLNPYWDDTFQAGDVVAVEPGLYGEDLRAGLRLEQNFLVTETGVERLSNFSLEL